MAIAFPLSLAGFMNLLPIRDLNFDCPPEVSVARTRGGELLPAEIGTRLWSGEITLDTMTRREAARIRPLIDLMGTAGASFLVTDPSRAFPLEDPGGVGLAVAAPVINSVIGTRELTVSGLPAGYVLSRDDLISFSYASSPTRYALHQLVTGSTASGAGVSNPVEVVPPIRQGAATGTAVALIRPVCKAIIVPGSVEKGRVRSGTLTEGMSFRWQQTLR